MPEFSTTLASVLLLVSMMAKVSGNKPLRLTLPPSDFPITGSQSANKSNRVSAGVYYGDASAPMAKPSPAPKHDESDNNCMHLHAGVALGIISGGHISGHYQSRIDRI